MKRSIGASASGFFPALRKTRIFGPFDASVVSDMAGSFFVVVLDLAEGSARTAPLSSPGLPPTRTAGVKPVGARRSADAVQELSPGGVPAHTNQDVLCAAAFTAQVPIEEAGLVRRIDILHGEDVVVVFR